MALVSITEAAKLTGKSTQTLYRHIKAGKLSKHPSGGLDTSELIRCYGELLQQNSSLCYDQSQHIESGIVTLLQQQVTKLEQDLKELKAESLERERQGIEREKRLMALLENQSKPTTNPTASSGIFSKLFK